MMNYIDSAWKLGASKGSPVKILHVITGLNTGGAEMMLWKLLSSTDRSYFSPAVLSLLTPGPIGPMIMELGIPVYSLGIQGSKLCLSALVRFSRILAHLRPHLVQGWMYHGNIAASIVGIRARCPVIWSIRCSTVAEDVRASRLTALVIRLGAALSTHPRAIIYNAKASLKTHEESGYSSRQAVVIPNGFDCTRFRPCPEARARLRTKLGIPPDAPVIGIVARNHPIKDVPTFLSATQHYETLNPCAHYVLVGRGLTSDREAYQGDRIHALGERQDIPNIVSGFDLFCLSSAGEGFSNAIGEAMACGIPCVATDVGDSAYLIGNTGRVVPPHEPRLMAEAWHAVLTEHPGPIALGSAARQRICENFSLESVTRRYEALYRGIHTHGFAPEALLSAP